MCRRVLRKRSEMIAELNRKSSDYIIMLILQKKRGTLHPSFLLNQKSAVKEHCWALEVFFWLYLKSDCCSTTHSSCIPAIWCFTLSVYLFFHYKDFIKVQWYQRHHDFSPGLSSSSPVRLYFTILYIIYDYIPNCCATHTFLFKITLSIYIH